MKLGLPKRVRDILRPLSDLSRSQRNEMLTEAGGRAKI